MPTHYEVITGLIEERDALAARLATLTAAGIVVGEDGAVRWHGLTGAEIETLKERQEAYEYLMLCAGNYVLTHRNPLRAEYYGEMVKAIDAIAEINVRTRWGKLPLAAAAGRGADGEAGE